MKRFVVACAACVAAGWGAMAAGTDGDNPIRLAFVGNSITRHPPRAELGWTNDWGMAASAADKDYVHLVARGLEKRTGRKVAFKIYGSFWLEREYGNEEKTRDALQGVVSNRPEIVVLAYGENVGGLTNAANIATYERSYRRTVRMMKDIGARVVVRTPFWDMPHQREVLRRIAREEHVLFADCSDLGQKPEMRADGRFKHGGVAYHPYDTGMAAMADRILAALVRNAAETAEMSVDFTQPCGELKRLNGIINTIKLTQYANSRIRAEYAALEPPYVRFHDAALTNPGAEVMDVSRIFPLFHLDENDPRNYDFRPTDDLLALCDEIGATPFFTLNPVWDTPEESVEWVKHCRGKALHWSLGNEMGYPHMEGPHSPREYAELVMKHAKAIKAAVPEVTFSGSGRYPSGGPQWIEEAAKPLATLAPAASFHHYGPSLRPHDYTSPTRIADLLKSMDASVDRVFDSMAKFRRNLPREIKISLDEWNLWYVWHREEGVTEGFWAARFLHRLIRDFAFFDFDNACYFQPINEGAIRVRARTSCLTPIGEVMVQMRRHAGGELVQADLPVELLATDHPDGSRYVTAINASLTESRAFTLPADGRTRLVDAELLHAKACRPGSVFAHETFGGATLANGTLSVALPPLSIAVLRLRP